MATTADRSVRPSLSSGQPYATARRQLWQLPMFLLGLLALIGVCAGRPTWREGDVRQMERDLVKVRRLLEGRRIETNQLLPVVERLVDQATRHAERAGEIHFLAGSAYVHVADRDPAGLMLDAWAKARTHLEEAQAQGVAEADNQRLTYLLAKTWYYTDADVLRAIETLERSIDAGADEPAEGYALLANAYLRLPTRDVAAALKANERELAVPYIDEELLAPARLLRGELLLELKKTEEARKVLANIGAQAPPGVLAKARYLRALSFQEEEHWKDAEELWRATLEDRAVPPREPALVLYNLGICYRRLDQPADAARLWSECLKRGDAGDAGAAAAINLAELRLAEPDSTPALEAFEQAVHEIKGPADWHNPLVDLNQAREVFEKGCDVFHKQARFEEAIRLARLYQALAPQGKAEAHLGRALYEKAEAIARNQGGQAARLEEARAIFREAGEAFEKASELTTVQADQHERLWHAVQSYAEASEPAKTIAIAERLVQSPLESERLGKTWFLKAEAHRALEQTTLALHAYGECIQYHTDLAFRARFQLATAEAGKQNVDEARNMLEQNLRLLRFETKPDAEALEKTRYSLARILFDGKDYRLSATHLEEALVKFPASVASLRARYDLAECYREMATEEAKVIAENDPKSAKADTHHNKEYTRFLEHAAERYQELAGLLGKRALEQPLATEEETLYWQAHLNAAHCQYLLGHYAETKGLYTQLAARYQGQAKELYALRNIASCCWTIGGGENTSMASQLVEKIRGLLAKLRDEELSIGPGSWDRRTWETWLEQVTKPTAKQ